MKKYLLPQTGNYYKANLHCHTNVSDGALSPVEVKEKYKANGYSVVAFTDHDILIPHPELNDDEFLALNGTEVKIGEKGHCEFKFLKECHLCMIALDPDNIFQPCFYPSRHVEANLEEYKKNAEFVGYLDTKYTKYSPEAINKMIKTFKDAGFFVTYNHPTWSMETYDQYSYYHGMDAMEIVNNSCCVLGQPEYNDRVYDEMLRIGNKIYCVGADDNHNKNADSDDSFGAYVMIKAEALEYKKITDALVKGDFYASQGPEIKELYFEDSEIFVTCSDAEYIAFTTEGRRSRRLVAKDGKALNAGSFKVLPDDGFVRITITDKNGKKAYTSAYFTDKLFD